MSDAVLLTNTETGEADVTDDLDNTLASHISWAAEHGVDPDALETIRLGDYDAAANLIGVRITENPDPAGLTEQEWTAWMAYHLDTDRYWSNGRVFIRIGDSYTGPIDKETWPDRGMAVQVCGVHASRERSWRVTDSWGELRRHVELADVDETEVLAEIACRREQEEAEWEPLREAHDRVLTAERALRAAEHERGRLMRGHIEQGMSKYQIAKVLGMTQPKVARIVGQDEG